MQNNAAGKDFDNPIYNTPLRISNGSSQQQHNTPPSPKTRNTFQRNSDYEAVDLVAAQPEDNGPHTLNSNVTPTESPYETMDDIGHQLVGQNQDSDHSAHTAAATDQTDPVYEDPIGNRSSQE